MGPFKWEVHVFARLWPVRVMLRVSFTTGAVQSAIVAIAWLLVVHVAYGRGSVILWRRRDSVCTSSFTDRMTSCFHAMGLMGRIKHDVMVKRVRQLDVRHLQCLVEFVRMWHCGAKLAIHDCLVFVCI